MKSALKQAFRLFATLAILPLALTHFLLSRFTGADASLESHSQVLSLIPGMIGSYVRVAFYRFSLQHCDPSATISFGVLFSKVGARIDANVYIGPRCMLGLVTLEPDVLLGPAVQIPSGPHTHGTQRLDVPIRTQPGQQRRVTIGRDSWIGGAAIVLADVAEQTVVGAGSVVTRPTEPRLIVAGNPARMILQRT